jgi:hypothetical protein
MVDISQEPSALSAQSFSREVRSRTRVSQREHLPYVTEPVTDLVGLRSRASGRAR